MKKFFYCKICWREHHIEELYEDSHPSRLQCKASVKKIDERKVKIEKVKHVSKEEIQKMLDKKATAKREIEKKLEQLALKKYLDDYSYEI